MKTMHPMIMLTIVDNEGQAIWPPTPFSRQKELEDHLKFLNSNPKEFAASPYRIATVDIVERKVRT